MERTLRHPNQRIQELNRKIAIITNITVFESMLHLNCSYSVFHLYFVSHVDLEVAIDRFNNLVLAFFG